MVSCKHPAFGMGGGVYIVPGNERLSSVFQVSGKDILYTGSKSSPTCLVYGRDFEVESYADNVKKGVLISRGL